MPSSRRKPRKKQDLHRPLSAEHLEQGRKLAERYQAIIWMEDGEYFGRGLELPWTFEDGKSPEECFAKLREAMAHTVAFMLEQGQRPPVPASEAQRTAQINIRVTPQEKDILEQAAKSRGYHGISDYLRDVALHFDAA